MFDPRTKFALLPLAVPTIIDDISNMHYPYTIGFVQANAYFISIINPSKLWPSIGDKHSIFSSRPNACFPCPTVCAPSDAKYGWWRFNSSHSLCLLASAMACRRPCACCKRHPLGWVSIHLIRFSVTGSESRPQIVRNHIVRSTNLTRKTLKRSRRRYENIWYKVNVMWIATLS